jgi:hypothetical protein
MPQFKDQSLIPQGAVRLCTLGLLQERDRPFGELAVEVRRFVSRMLGPSLDILGTSIETLRYQGMIEPLGPRASPGQSLTGDTLLRVTDAGRQGFIELMTSPVRAPMTDLSKLIVALKLRFLPALDRAEQRVQLEQLMEVSEQEIARLRDLRTQHDTAGDLLGDWLAQDIAQTESRIAWYRDRLATL